MQFINNITPTRELTYQEVFLIPQYSTVRSRMDVDLSSPDLTGTTIPLIAANMMSVTGKRMAETIARRGGLAVFPQDLPAETVAEHTAAVKKSHLTADTAVTLTSKHTVHEAMELICQTSHRTVIVVDGNRHPVGIFTEQNQKSRNTPSTYLEEAMTPDPVIIPQSTVPADMFNLLTSKGAQVAAVVDNEGRAVGMITEQNALRSTIYTPAVSKDGKLLTAAAVGINGNVADRAAMLAEAGVDVLVVDTAHGHQQRMLEMLQKVKSAVDDCPVAAGNVVTRQGVYDLINAGADIVKIGIGPGAMCTTRMMTGVGRPQFSAVVECAAEARNLGRHVWADGGVKHPRDVVLAIAAGASNVMIGSWFAGTLESASDACLDDNGRLYKVNYGMASSRAVSQRVHSDSRYVRAVKEQFKEGISESRMYVNPQSPGVEDVIDNITAGLRSAFAYTGAFTISQFQDRARVGIQSAAGYIEGQPLPDGDSPFC